MYPPAMPGVDLEVYADMYEEYMELLREMNEEEGGTFTPNEPDDEKVS